MASSTSIRVRVTGFTARTLKRRAAAPIRGGSSTTATITNEQAKRMARLVRSQPCRRWLRPDRTFASSRRQSREALADPGLLRELRRPGLLNDERGGPCGRFDQVAR